MDELFARYSVEMTLTMIKCDADGFYAVCDEFWYFSDYIHLSIKWTTFDQDLIILIDG